MRHKKVLCFKVFDYDLCYNSTCCLDFMLQDKEQSQQKAGS